MAFWFRRIACVVVLVAVAHPARALDGMVVITTKAGPSLYDYGQLKLLYLSTMTSSTIITDNVNGASFSPDGYGISFSRSGKICTCDLLGDNVVELADCGPDDSQISTTWADDGYIYWSQNDHFIRRVAAAGGTAQIVLTHDNDITGAGVSHDGTKAAWASPQGTGSGNSTGEWGYCATADLVAGTIHFVDGNNDYYMPGCQGDISDDGAFVLNLQTHHRILDIWEYPGGITHSQTVNDPSPGQVDGFIGHRFPNHMAGYVTYSIDGGDFRCSLYHLSTDTPTIVENGRIWDVYPTELTADPTAVRVSSFSATPIVIAEGMSSTLSWATVNADTVTITPDVGTVAANDSVVVTPAATTMYTLTATGPSGPAVSTVTVTVVPPNTPDRWWKFDEASGTTAADSSGNAVDGSLVNMGGTEWTTGMIDGALAFDGTDDHISIPDNTVPTADYYVDGDFTIAMCVKPTKDAAMMLAFRSTESAAWWATGRSVYIAKSGSGPMVVEAYCNDGTAEFATGTTPLVVDTWYHVAMVCDVGGNAGGLRVYLNGELEGSAWMGSPGGWPQDSWFIGRAVNDRSLTAFGGLIDDVRVFNSALSDTDVGVLYDAAFGGGGDADPTVAITTPTDGAHVYDLVDVNGAADDDLGVDKVEVSVDGGAFMDAVGTVTWDTWTYSFDATALSEGDCDIVARVTDTSGHTATTTITVVIDPAATQLPSITVTAPEAGDIWYVGTTRYVRWTAVNLENAAIHYATDGGTYYTSVTDDVPITSASWGAYAWVVPDAPSTTCVVNVSGYLGEVPTDSGVFTIAAIIDTDSDGMDDGWETATFGDLDQDATTNADGDGSTDYEEFMGGTDPLVADVTGGTTAAGGALTCVPAMGGGYAGVLEWAVLLAAALASLRRR